MKHLFTKRIVPLALVLSLALSGAFMYYNGQPAQIAGIQEYTPNQDKPFVEKQFKDHLDLLTCNPDTFDVHHVFDTRSPNPYETQYFGKMKIKVYKEKGVPVGLVTYYMETAYQGRILFLVVDNAYQHKGYGRKLMQYAIEQLKLSGAKIIKLFTLHVNKKAQKLYESLGFVPVATDKYGLFYRLKV